MRDALKKQNSCTTLKVKHGISPGQNALPDISFYSHQAIGSEPPQLNLGVVDRPLMLT